ncbi:MAG TPA: MarR family transcriptional regulator, partial [Acidimicrobiales bacterium]|nr:MarR family transcriptional regulator [Acidimicrobiales bacterium]
MAQTRRAAAARQVRWLTAEEERGWRAVASVMHKLRWALECQLEQDSDLSFIEYHALARLSEEPDRTLRMSELAVLTNSSLSRLSHLVTRLEKWGFVRREADKTDGRFTNAILTKAGYAKLVSSAPAHVAAVRQLVIDEFGPAELEQLHDFCERIVAQVDASTW